MDTGGAGAREKESDKRVSERARHAGTETRIDKL